MAMLAVTVTAGWAQARLCSELPPIEREFARAFGACRDLAPIINVAPVFIPVPNVVGLTFDDARARLTGFEVRHSYRASGEPGGTVLAQEPAPPARAATGAPITVVVSDGSLRQRPLVGESEIDGVKRPLEAPEQPRVVPRRPSSAPPQQARTAPVQRSAQTSVPQTTQVTAARRRSAAQSETVEVPNVVGRSGADASRLLADFKVDRIEVVANAAPSGQVLAQDPAPGTAVAPGSTIGLQMSDGSLANPAATTPAVSSARSPATPPVQTPTDASTPSVQSRQFAITSMSNGALILIGVVLTGLVLGALLMRRRALGAAPAVEAITAEPTGTAPVAVVPVEIAPADVALPETDRGAVPLPEIRVAARLDAGETTIEFTALEADETTLEDSRELHE